MRKRKTIQQKLVFEALNALCDHPTAQEIHTKVQQAHQNISIATVYSNLKSLAESGAVRVLSLAGRSDRYDKNLVEHHHIYCQRCGALCDLPPVKTAQVDARLAETSGYIVTGYEVLFHGLCPQCQTTQNNQERMDHNE